MDQLREWLGPFVDGICRDAVTWDEEGVGSSQESGAGSCRRHGDLCWVQITKAHLSGLRKVVQIQEFLTYEDPIKAVLSDSFTVIECVFSPSGEKAFRQSHQGQRITQHTQGGNLALKWFNLLIPMTGTPMSKFRLLIHDCQYLGSGGSALFGRPIAIETRTGMAGIVRNLSVHLSRQSGGMRTSSDGGKGREDGLEVESPVLSQSGDRDSPPNTQRCIATQPQKVSAVSGRSFSRAGLLDVLAQLQKPRAGATDRPARQLDCIRSVDPVPPINVQPDASGTSRETTMSNPRADPRVESLELDDATAEVGGPRRLKVTPRRRRSDSPAILGKQETPRKQSRVQDGPSLTKALPEDEKENSPGRLQSRQETMAPKTPARTLENTRPGADEVKQVTSVAERAVADVDPWLGMKRIRRRDVRIPKDQAKLLESPLSWLPPEPGNREPIANVPITVLEELNKKAERRARKRDRGHGSSEEATSPEPQPEEPKSLQSEGEGEDEVLSDSVSWDSSPSRPAKGDQLPPDSSPETSPLPALKRSRDDWRSSAMSRHHEGTPPAKRRRSEQPAEDSDGDKKAGRERDEIMDARSGTSRSLTTRMNCKSVVEGGPFRSSRSNNSLRSRHADATVLLTKDHDQGIVDAEQQLMGELQSFASSPNLVGPNQKTVITQDYQRAGDRGRLREPESDADESDLETSVPNALGDEPLKDEDPSEHEVAIPVDRAGQSHAVLQVERTPHMRGNSAEAAVVEVISDSQIRPAPSRADGAVAVRAGKKRRFFEDSESPVTGSKTTKSCVGWSRCSNVESSRIRSPQEPGIHHTPGVVLASSVTRKSPASGRATGNDTTRTLSQQASRRVISPPEVKRAPQVVPPALARGEGSDILTSPDETSKSGGRGKAVTSQERPWWTDKNTPFKRFSREYARLKAVDGELGEVDEKRGGLIPVRTRVDVLSWDI